MSASLEAQKHRREASMITAGFAVLMLLLMFLLKWEMPVIEKITEAPGIEVELNLPEEPFKSPEARLLHEVEYRWNTFNVYIADP